jgi:hypothetical protein
MVVRTGASMEPLGVAGESPAPVLVAHGISLAPHNRVRDGKPAHTPIPRGLVSPDTDHHGRANPESAVTHKSSRGMSTAGITQVHL